MKKSLLATTLILGLMSTSSAFGASISVGNVKVNLPQNTTKAKKVTKTTTKTSTTTANEAKIKAQINTINNKLNSVSTTYEQTVNDMVNNLVTGKELNEYKAKVNKLKASSKSNIEINIDIAEDGSDIIDDVLEQMDVKNIKNLPAAKKAAIQKDLNTLKTTAANYTSISKDATALAASIKSDPAAAMANAPELYTLGKNAKEAAKQAKNISKLSSTVVKAFANAGVKLK